jgi:hypothetical protein
MLESRPSGETVSGSGGPWRPLRDRRWLSSNPSRHSITATESLRSELWQALDAIISVR